MPNLTLYVKDDLPPLVDKFKQKLEAEGTTLSSWFDEQVRRAAVEKKVVKK